MANKGSTKFFISWIKLMWGLAAFSIVSLAAYQFVAPLALAPSHESLPVPSTWTASQTPSLTPTGTPLQSSTPQATSVPDLVKVLTPSSKPTQVFYEPAGCRQPPDDYTLVQINNNTLNARTYAMLQQAALLYDGEIDVAGKAIIQGCYSNNCLDNPGAQLSGGELDISVTRLNSSFVLYTEIEPLIQALRTAGFAAWLRDADVPGPKPGIYIHAIAIGDRDLSPAAQEQLTGSAGYLRGYDGLSVTGGFPGFDRHGGPLICRWMLDAGYGDLRTPTPIPPRDQVWQERLRQVSLTYQAFYPEDAEQIAISLDFLEDPIESAGNVCGPLAAAILRDAGLLPTQPGPVNDLKSYWQARPIDNGRPWSLFSERDYEVFHFDTPLAKFDFSIWPLQPGDFLYTYASKYGFEHMFIVTEVDAEGRAYTVTNQYQAWGNTLWGDMLILRYLLYDPHHPGEGIIYNEWSDIRLGLTGQNGFDVLRKRGLQAGILYEYAVRPGDTLPELASRFGALQQSLVQANPGLDLANLHVGQLLSIPIPPFPLDSPEPLTE